MSPVASPGEPPGQPPGDWPGDYPGRRPVQQPGEKYGGILGAPTRALRNRGGGSVLVAAPGNSPGICGCQRLADCLLVIDDKPEMATVIGRLAPTLLQG